MPSRRPARGERELGEHGQPESVRWVADVLDHADPSLTLRVYAHALREEQHDLSFLDLRGAKRQRTAPIEVGAPCASAIAVQITEKYDVKIAKAKLAWRGVRASAPDCHRSARAAAA